LHGSVAGFSFPEFAGLSPSSFGVIPLPAFKDAHAPRLLEKLVVVAAFVFLAYWLIRVIRLARTADCPVDKIA
jgi:hypothetical protein